MGETETPLTSHVYHFTGISGLDLPLLLKTPMLRPIDIRESFFGSKSPIDQQRVCGKFTTGSEDRHVALGRELPDPTI